MAQWFSVSLPWLPVRLALVCWIVQVLPVLSLRPLNETTDRAPKTKPCAGDLTVTLGEPGAYIDRARVLN